jgi:hypothetical protein
VTARTATVAHDHVVPIVTRFETFDDSITADGLVAGFARLVTDVARFERARGATAIALLGIAVVTGLVRAQ